MRIAALAPILASLLIVACQANESNSSLLPGTQLLLDQKIVVGSAERNFHLFKPATPSTADIVFLYHGFTGSADQILGLDNTVAPYKLWLNIAERENLILVIPDGSESSSGRQGWNDCRADIPAGHPDSDDVEYFMVLLETIQNQFDALTGNTYVMGTSNGGFMTQRLADEVPEMLDAVAIVVASRPVSSVCLDSRVPVPILVMNGTEDPLTPYEGGQIASNRGEVLSTADMIDYWVERNQTSSTPSITPISDLDPSENSTIRVHSYVDGSNQTSVVLVEMINAGHTEPSLTEHYGPLYKLIVGNQNRDIEMADVVWQFFRDQQ